MIHLEDVARKLLIVSGGLGVPYIVRVEEDGTWICVFGIFKGRKIQNDKKILHVCQDGDVFHDIDMTVTGGKLEKILPKCDSCGHKVTDHAVDGEERRECLSFKCSCEQWENPR